MGSTVVDRSLTCTMPRGWLDEMGWLSNPSPSACVLVLQVKWLSFFGGVLIELSGRQASIPRVSGIAKEVCPLLLEGLDHPFKACREEIAR